MNVVRQLLHSGTSGLLFTPLQGQVAAIYNTLESVIQVASSYPRQIALETVINYQSSCQLILEG